MIGILGPIVMLNVTSLAKPVFPLSQGMRGVEALCDLFCLEGYHSTLRHLLYDIARCCGTSEA